MYVFGMLCVFLAVACVFLFLVARGSLQEANLYREQWQRAEKRNVALERQLRDLGELSDED